MGVSPRLSRHASLYVSGQSRIYRIYSSTKINASRSPNSCVWKVSNVMWRGFGLVGHDVRWHGDEGKQRRGRRKSQSITTTVRIVDTYCYSRWKKPRVFIAAHESRRRRNTAHAARHEQVGLPRLGMAASRTQASAHGRWTFSSFLGGSEEISRMQWLVSSCPRMYLLAVGRYRSRLARQQPPCLGAYLTSRKPRRGQMLDGHRKWMKLGNK